MTTIYCITWILTFSIVLFFRLGRSYYKGPKSDHFDGKFFFNPHGQYNITQTSTFELLKWHFFTKREKPTPWPKKIFLAKTSIPEEIVLGSDLVITNVGHATFLIQTEGLNILTDPIWSDRIGFYGPFGINRVIEPGIKFQDLPPIDLVFISHNHYDHLDLSTLKKLWKEHKPRIITTLGTDSVIKSFDKSIEVEAYDWQDEVKISDKVKFHLMPANHWSARQVFDRRKALWAAVVIQSSSGNIYFAGDTSYAGGHNFIEAKKKFGDFRCALLPMGAYEPRWFMQHVHMNPEDFIRAHIDLGKPQTVPYHYDVFRLTDENFGQAILDMRVAMQKYNVKENIFPLGVGESMIVKNEAR